MGEFRHKRSIARLRFKVRSQSICILSHNVLHLVLFMMVKRLVWDEWNVGYIARHEVVVGEVEEVCRGDVLVNKTYAGRLRVVGQTLAGRWLTAILAPKRQAVYYPVTARPASRKEQKRYRELKEGEQL